jgi:hypothetical protein
MNESEKMLITKGFLTYNQTVPLYGVILIIDSTIWDLMLIIFYGWKGSGLVSVKPK